MYRDNWSKFHTTHHGQNVRLKNCIEKSTQIIELANEIKDEELKTKIIKIVADLLNRINTSIEKNNLLKEIVITDDNDGHYIGEFQYIEKRRTK